MELTPSNYYKKSDHSIWTGRKTELKIGPQYWYQHMQYLDLSEALPMIAIDQGRQIVIMGYACDTGVVRNQGRAGAVNGPAACRERLSKLAFHHDHIRVSDGGDIICPNDDLASCQAALSYYIRRLLDHAFFPIVIGGGHDIAYGHFLGMYHSALTESGASIGIVNFDAHFDLRPSKTIAHSGTPFYQILSAYHSSVDYLVLGIQEESNTPSLFNIAHEYNVKYVRSAECRQSNWDDISESLRAFAQDVDHLYISIDLDGISSAFAPGVSAPSPLGMTPRFLFQCLTLLIQTDKVISCDIAELNPTYDIDSISCTLAARIVNHITRELNKRQE